MVEFGDWSIYYCRFRIGSKNYYVDISWYRGNERHDHFVISTSTDGTTFINKLTRDNNGTTTNTEGYTIPSVDARYIRITVNGNTQNTGPLYQKSKFLVRLLLVLYRTLVL